MTTVDGRERIEIRMTDTAERTFEELMQTSTAPDPVPFVLIGFEREYADKLANHTAVWIKYIGTRLNLERLDGITIAFDYPKALADLDRGYETSFVNKPTTEFAQGVAMSPVVKRDGVIKTRIVLDAGVFNSFLDQDGENWRMLFYQLAHECGHVHDHYAFDEAFPGVFLAPPNFPDGLSRHVFQMGNGCWCEYAASRLSADFVPEQVVHFEETFFTVFKDINQRTAALTEKFEDDGDVIAFFNGLSQEYERLMRFASYLLGHLNGLGGDVATAPQFKELLESGHWIAGFIKALDEAFDDVWAQYGAWKDLDDFGDIGTVVQLLVARHGLHASVGEGGGMYVSFVAP